MEWLKRYTAAMLGLIMIVATGITAHAEETCRNNYFMGVYTWG